MRILVNGAWHEVGSLQLSAALAELGYGARTVSTAVNGEFVAAGSRERTTLRAGDRVEVLAPMQGG